MSEQSWWLGRNLSASLLWVPHYNIPLGWRGRLFVTIHDVAHLALPEFRGNFVKRSYAEILMRHIRRRAIGIAFDSEFTRQEFDRLVGPPRGRSSVIPLGVDPVWLLATSDKPASRPYLIFLGNIKPNKNLVRLLEAFGRLVDQIPHDLVLVGQRDGFLSGDDRAVEFAAKLGERVRFTNKVADEEVRQYVAGADLLVMPSIYEGFGLPVLEAMACGCPVLASRVASLPEVGGDAVAYCDPYDVSDIAQNMGSLLSDPSKRLEMSRLGRLQARRFDWDIVAAKMEISLCPAD
jgi:glycosyltransferase involved in cell wall biosynthesis